MKVEDLEKNTLIKEIVDAIIADETFKEKCSSNVKRIFEDGKVDLHDIPLMINLTVMVYNNYSKIRVSKKNMKPVFMLLITRLLIELKGDGALDEELILLMLEPQIDILLMMVSTLKCPSSCCASKPSKDKVEKEEHIVYKMKVNKLETQSKLNKPVSTNEVLIK